MRKSCDSVLRGGGGKFFIVLVKQWTLATFLCYRVSFSAFLCATGYMVWRDFLHKPVTSLVKHPPGARGKLKRGLNRKEFDRAFTVL